MADNFLLYNFDTQTTDYPTGYDSSKLNLGYLMSKNTDENNQIYVSPLEPKFIRGYEIVSQSPYVYPYTLNSLGSLKYNDDVTWLFYAGGGSQGTIPKRFFLASHKKSTNKFTEIGSINVNYNPNNAHNTYSITPSMEYHTGGTVTVNGSSVIGLGTNWQTDGVCVGNRIGFGSTDSNNIMSWYQITSVDSDTGITISKEFISDGNPNNLIITGATSYVIEDFRLIYANYGGASATSRGIALVKGLRYELFQITNPTTIPAGTTIDNIRACYRILDTSITSASFSPIGLVLMDKTSFTDQDLYTMSYPGSTTTTIQKFNIRSPLTLTAGRSNTPFLFTTGSQNHGGTNTGGYRPMVTDFNGNFYVTNHTRISRIPISGITNGSTTFISDEMIENPPGTSTTYPLSSQLIQSQYLRVADKFYVSHIQGTIRNYIYSYSVGGEFDIPVHINDQIQQSTYLIDKFDNLTTNFLSTLIYSHYSDNGLLFVVRDGTSNNNVIYSLPIEADKDFHTITNACIITPELSTLSATSYNRVYLDLESTFNKDTRFYIPRENCDIYYRTSGISADTGSWTLIPETGEISGSSNSIQYKITFRTAGLYSIPCKVKGIIMSYYSLEIPSPITFYEPSIKNTVLSSNTFSWRQNSLFNTQIPNLNIDIYDTSNNLLLTDSVSGSTSGTWEYSSDDGSTWNLWSYSANTVGNYIRYNATTLSAPGLIVKPILYI
jgi:hypothetical protein